jgi:hypothetical protein
MLGSITSMSAYFGLAVRRHGIDIHASAVPANHSSRLFDHSSVALSSSREQIDQIASALTKVRNALQAIRERVGFVPGRADLQAIVTDFEQTADRAIYGTQDIYETHPVYEEEEIRATIVNGTRDLSSFNSLGAAGITGAGHYFTVRVGSGSVATIEFEDSKHIEVTIDGSTQSFAFDDKNGEWRAGLVNALNSVANLSAEITADGTLRLETANAESLTINGASNPNKDPLAAVGLVTGTTGSTVVGTEQVQVGTEEVKIGTEQVRVGTIQFSLASRPITVGYDRVDRAPAEVTEPVKSLARAVATLLSGVSPNAARGFAANVTELLGSDDFKAAVNTTDVGVLDRVIERINDTLSNAERLRAPISARESATTQVDVSSMLLSASLNAFSATGPGQGGNSPYRRSSNNLAGARISFWT